MCTNNRAIQIHTEGTGDNVRGTGVKFTDGNNQWNAWVNKDVIVAAGAIATPQLLQLSGIGEKAHLESLGINTVIDLPGVGKNLQEQTMSIVGWNPKATEDINTLSDVIAYPDMKALFADEASTIASMIQDNVEQYASDAVAAGAVVSQGAGEYLLKSQANLMISKGVGLLELFFDSGGYKINAWNLLPFARGSVSITSTDYNTPPRLDTRSFAAEVDKKIQIQGARMARQIFKSAPLRNMVPDDGNGGSDESWWNWISDSWLSVNHPIGTCSMMLKDHGGVVDSNLRVYHSSNIRIVDASVLPFQLSAHLSATLYGLAENAADIIKAGQ